MVKKVYYTNDKELQGLRWAAKVIDFGVSLSVKAAINELYSAFVLLKERKDLFRHKIKQYANLAIQAAERKEKEILEIMKSKDFFNDYSDAVIDFAHNDIAIFRISLKQVMDNAKIKDSELFSYIEVCRVLLALSVNQFDAIMEETATRFGRNYKKDFDVFYINEILQKWNKLCDELYAGCTVNLNTQQTKLLYENLSKKFAEGKYVQQCLKIAEDAHPGFSNKIEIK